MPFASDPFKFQFRLSALNSKAQNIVSVSDSSQKSVEDCSTERSAIETVAVFIQIHLQVLGAGTMVSTVNESLRIADDPVKPLQMLTIWTKVLGLMDVVFRRRQASRTIVDQQAKYQTEQIGGSKPPPYDVIR